MTERTAIAQKVQIGVETTPGTAVPANRLLPGLSIDAEPQGVTQDFTPQGQKYRTIVAEQKEWMQAPLRGFPTFDEIIYSLSSVISRSNPAAALVPDGTGSEATGAYKWIFDSATDNEDNPVTYTVEMGSGVRAHRFSNGIVREFGFNINRDSVELTGQMIATRLEDGITMTSSPTALPLVPMLSTEFDMFIDPTYGALGTTKLGRFFDGKFVLNNRYGPFWTVDSSLTSYTGVVETAPTAQWTMVMEADSNGMAYLNQFRAGTTVFGRLRAIGPNIYSVNTARTGATHSSTTVDGITPVLTAADVGKVIAGAGIPVGATIVSQTGAACVISAAATATASGVALTIGTAIPYSFTLDMALKVREPGKFNDHEGIYAIEFPFEIVNDFGWTHPFHAEVVCSRSAL